MVLLLLKLFYTFFKIGLFGFGGGYAMISMIQGEVVTRYEWLSSSDFTDIIAIIRFMKLWNLLITQQIISINNRTGSIPIMPPVLLFSYINFSFPDCNQVYQTFCLILVPITPHP